MFIQWHVYLMACLFNGMYFLYLYYFRYITLYFCLFLYSFGMVLWECITHGRTPFEEEKKQDIIRKMVSYVIIGFVFHSNLLTISLQSSYNSN